ncbi:prepilin-type N-terminal cleavage/methylation domain-containing protein [Nitratireductor sp. ZSWI3]|uniref:prepilin-type N-terminal cleavage/methylation domain-containing protein n=1 Tax=Nitratireductor sp. ZSWI3 TaxID=2966359 RepID=UPI00214FC3A4|nr:prepilin-type N-terminal cleavage/methylation domain-containing protein [Nitratireductor sp. ZSWI3]MCR4265786.1 prepilin-type N-terminal cleavage/methylation domain-containing protein [Nitratireductor sp. ZSWI3]
MAKPNRAIEGFTLVEMLVALAVLALVIGVSVPALRGNRSSGSTEAVAREIQMLLWRARVNAIAQGGNSTVLIDIPHGEVRYAVVDRTISIPDTMTATLLTGRELVAADGEAALVFFPDGASSGAELRITDERGKRSSVLVPWLTGIPTLLREQ